MKGTEHRERVVDPVYRSGHVGPLRNRRDWFEPLEGPSLVLWWIPEGHVPTVEEAKEKLRLLEENGPGPEAFTFRSSFPPPGKQAGPTPEVDAEFCGGAGYLGEG